MIRKMRRRMAEKGRSLSHLAAGIPEHGASLHWFVNCKRNL